MTLLCPLIYLIAIGFHCVHSDVIDSNGSKSEDRDHNSRPQSAYESVYSSQSLHTTNGLNSPQQSLALSESNSGPYYSSSGHQTNDQIDQNKNDNKKTLILAIPVKLSHLKSGQDNYDQSIPKSSELSQSQSQTKFYANIPSYMSSGQSSLGSSAPLEPEESDQSDQSVPKSGTLPPLSHKIYSSLESQLMSSSYSSPNSQKSSEQSMPSSLSYSSNDHKYKNSYDLKDQKSIGSQYGRDANTYRGNEYKSANNEGQGLANDYGLKYSNKKPVGQLTYKYEDSFGEFRPKTKDNGKQVYESIRDSKPEYDYGEEEEEEEEVDDKKVEDDYTFGQYKPYQTNKNGYNTKNLRKNVNNEKNYGNYGTNPSLIANLFGNGKAITAQTLPLYSTDQLDGWQQYYYKQNLNGLPRLPESIDTNLLSLMNSYQNPIKDNVRNNLYAPAFDLTGLSADSQLKVTSNPLKTMENSKIYGPAAKYQSSYPMINLLSGYGYGHDFGLLDMNGELYPTPLAPPIVPQPTPRNPHKPVQQNDLKGDHNSANRDSIKNHRRNPLLLRPSFISGLRSRPKPNESSANGGLNGGLFGSASTPSLFSVLPSLPSLPSLPTGFNINAKSIPRQIFPYFYG